MWEYLNFPEEYKVSKYLGKDRYLKLGNLTDGERRAVEGYMESAQILYSIPYEEDNSEMIVLRTDLKYANDNDKYFLRNYVNAIAQSIPHMCLIIVYYRGVAKFFIFDERINKYYSNRAKVECMYATDDIILEEFNYQDDIFLKRLRKAINIAYTASELHNMWTNLIQEHAQRTDKLVTCTFEASVERLKKCIEEGELRSQIDTGDFFTPLTIEEPDDSTYKTFVEFCINQSSQMYWKICNRNCFDISEEDFITEYIEACNKYALFKIGRNLAINSAQKIREAFYDGKYLRKSYCGVYLVEELKRYLPERFFN